ncbi:hypothetical protein COW36_19665 [bacterium (Candidatus Blackallbacteria) CG17_big_fil_post_rev_8_21_14_2_50_48_46]|uniref:Phosphohistidine phosphatase SixA n=1 Tax=bacterium (Candidatus Blackallbacteria) CG17_big_fil_post_rev_8_21_14_2_50_48_46 TaxID=2014261 RepID=A0A2M7FZN8_9BACT|nr:MAG: hypothetical protein COW64_15630 [bacterium (Candidatus Blackallbacteria) CG18_big_fil_WC_8_21_14_2_50_49_26]PIW14871.1 MAG: hypothetical protein COW36_19665 [bacterium (Candidatus Blackallbacteria) CG17_big_fil_post_rev_8_21_14_2_50_48_46]PIW44438.1 MAG: hypothetical protein COW20_24240 [bacterium (Candidatus Blackallbacteria) CG13_big_fil_rev_8_21_14_2_50_49_14]
MLAHHKYLILIRHAEAQEDHGDIPDTERTLTARGLKQLNNLSERLPVYWQAQALFASHACRSLDSARRLAPFWNLETDQIQIEALIYEASGAEKLVEFLSGLDDSLDAVALVGHNPLLNGLMEMLTACPSPGFPKGAMAGLLLPLSSWQALEPGLAQLSYFQIATNHQEKLRRVDLERRLIAHLWSFMQPMALPERPDNLRELVFKQAARLARKMDPLLPELPHPPGPPSVLEVQMQALEKPRTRQRAKKTL